MNAARRPADPVQQARLTLPDRLLADWATSNDSKLLNSPGLLIHNPAYPEPGCGGLGDAGADMFRLCGSSQESRLVRANTTVVTCTAASLPIQDASLGFVVLSHLIASGHEDLLSESCRVLQPGGHLFILGFNRLGAMNLLGRSQGVPAIRPLELRRHLESLQMEFLGLHAAGFLTRSQPGQMDRGLSRILLPLADVFLLVARRLDPEIINPVFNTRLRAVGTPTALAGR